MKFLSDIQKTLEENYGAFTGLDVRHFVREAPQLKELGTLLVEHEVHSDDLNVALLFDRDVLQAVNAGEKALEKRSLSVSFEEVSHFVYLSFNHGRGRNITTLEMEMQSEIDRIVLAFSSSLNVGSAKRDALLQELLEKPYENIKYEEARLAASKFIRQLSGGDPSAWSPREQSLLRQFFHSDLSEKLRLAGSQEKRL